MLLFAQYVFLIFYSLVLGVLAIYGLHRYHLVYLYYRNRRKEPRPLSRFEELPKVTIQLPMYNEQYVARRIIEHCCRIDYPRDRLLIQVLDDSTDETGRIARETVERMRADGHNVVYLHRDDRSGFKAGALDYGMASVEGDFICIFDADFVPEPDILHRTIHYFTDPKVGMVQARWDHINRDHSMLTRTQAIFLDGHFMIEKTARNRTGRFINFSGTAGLWRRQAIDGAGGWEHDTLTEDLDLSYRAQLVGWKFVFLPDVVSPAELPPEMNAFKQQQFRWTKGGTQTAIKLLPRVLRSKLPLFVKVEALFHLTGCITYVLMVLLTLMLFPAFYIKLSNIGLGGVASVLIDMGLFLLASCSASTFYLCSQQEIYRDWREKLKYLPFLMSLGIGISLSNTKAVLEVLFGKKSDFIRTPKFGAQSSTDRSWRQRAGQLRHKLNWMPYVEFLFGCYVAVCIGVSLLTKNSMRLSLPFLCLFMFGYFYVSLSTLMGGRLSRSAGAPTAAPPAPAPLAPQAPRPPSDR